MSARFQRCAFAQPSRVRLSAISTRTNLVPADDFDCLIGPLSPLLRPIPSRLLSSSVQPPHFGSLPSITQSPVSAHLRRPDSRKRDRVQGSRGARANTLQQSSRHATARTLLYLPSYSKWRAAVSVETCLGKCIDRRALVASIDNDAETFLTVAAASQPLMKTENAHLVTLGTPIMSRKTSPVFRRQPYVNDLCASNAHPCRPSPFPPSPPLSRPAADPQA